MKKIITMIAVALTIGVVAFTSPGGAPANKAGTPAYPSTCTSCHSGGSNAMQAGWITSNVPASGYVAGTTYTITCTATYSGRSVFGFEVSPQNAAGTVLGTLIVTNSAQTQSISTGKYMTHTAGGISGSNSKTWSFGWTAPAAGTGSVTFYGAFLCADGDGTEMGDETYKSTLTIAESAGCIPPAQPGTIAGSASVCVGSSQAYSVAAVTGATSYTWTLPSGWTGSSTTNSITTVAGSSSGTISVTANSACSSTPQTLSVTSNANPVATISPNGATTFCQGGSVTLTASAGSSYLWSPGGATSQSIIVSSSGSYTVKVTNASGCFATSAATTVTVNASGVPTITAGGSTSICQGNSVTLTSSAGSTYLWSPGGQTTQSISVSTAGSYTVAVTGTCPGTSAATVVTVNPLPSPTISAGGPTTFCQGGNVTLTSSSGSSYLWSPGGATTSSVTVSTGGNYTVHVTNSSGCSGNSAATTVGVNPLPSVTLGTFASVCTTDSAFTLSGGNPAGGIYSGTGVTNGIFDPAVSGSGTFNITYSFTNANGCTNTVVSAINVSTCSGSGCTTSPPRPGSITGPVSNTCNLAGAVYSIAPVAGATSYHWTVPSNVVIANNNGTSITVNFLPGFVSGTISVSAVNSCGTSYKRYLSVVSKIVLTGSMSGLNEVCITQNSVVYSIPAVTGATSYQWSISNGATITGNGNTAVADFTTSNNRHVQVKVRVANACGLSDSKKMMVTVHHDCTGGQVDDRYRAGTDPSAPISILAYPNPAIGKMMLDITAKQAANCQVKMFDLFGKTVVDKMMPAEEGLNSFEINVDGIKPGIYMLHVEADGIPSQNLRVMIMN
ncbi:MAG: T9SS type A sorting domain-containing protein [Bacteroidetes bacterium]|nr:T9SS type A sorting domain-containing protein [Bacteroidota bacterium]